MDYELSDLMQFEFTGGVLPLDFTNTADGDVRARWTERLTSYDDLVGWSVQAGTISEAEALRLLQQAAQHRAEAASVVERAIALRWTIYRIFSAIAHDEQPDSGDLVAFNAALSHALPHLQVTSSEGGYEWAWDSSAALLEHPLWPVVWSAAELLVSDRRALVRECGGETCSWLFLDTSRNHSRRWCDMKGCGNRAKARRYYRRTRNTD